MNAWIALKLNTPVLIGLGLFLFGLVCVRVSVGFHVRAESWNAVLARSAATAYEGGRGTSRQQTRFTETRPRGTGKSVHTTRGFCFVLRNSVGCFFCYDRCLPFFWFPFFFFVFLHLLEPQIYSTLCSGTAIGAAQYWRCL